MYICFKEFRKVYFNYVKTNTSDVALNMLIEACKIIGYKGVAIDLYNHSTLYKEFEELGSVE